MTSYHHKMVVPKNCKMSDQYKTKQPVHKIPVDLK